MEFRNHTGIVNTHLSPGSTVLLKDIGKVQPDGPFPWRQLNINSYSAKLFRRKEIDNIASFSRTNLSLLQSCLLPGSKTVMNY